MSTTNDVTKVIWIGPISQNLTSDDIKKIIGNDRVVIRHYGNYAFIDTYSASAAKGIIEDWKDGRFDLPGQAKLQLAQSKRVSDSVWFGNLNGFRTGDEFMQQVDAIAKHKTYRFIRATNSAIVGFNSVADATDVLNQMDGMRYGGFVVKTNYFHKKQNINCASTVNGLQSRITYKRKAPEGILSEAPESKEQSIKRQKTTHDTAPSSKVPTKLAPSSRIPCSDIVSVPTEVVTPVVINVMSIMSTCLQPAKFLAEPKPNNPIEIDIKINGVYRMTVLASSDELVEELQNGVDLDFTHFTTVPNMENLVMCLFPGQKRQVRLYMAEEEDRFAYELIKQHCSVGVYFGAPRHGTYTIIRLKNINNSLVLMLD